MSLKISGIYMILNTINNKCYVGSSKNLSSRKSEHFRKLKNNKHESAYLQASYNKYGSTAFVFIKLEEVTDSFKLTEREIHWIKLKNNLDKNKGYNLSLPDNSERSEETKTKVLINSYKQHIKNNEISLEDWLKGKRLPDTRLPRGPMTPSKRILVFDKNTGQQLNSFASIEEAKRFLNISDSYYRSIVNKLNRSYKGLILVKEEDYDPSIIYKKTPKERVQKIKVYIKKGPFKGYAVETYNLETKETIKQYLNKHEVAKEFNSSVNYINKIFEGSKKSFRGMGLRYIKKGIQLDPFSLKR